MGSVFLGSILSFLKRLLRREPSIEKLEESGKELLALSDYGEAGNRFEQAAEAALKQKRMDRAIENFLAAGRIYRNVDNWKAAKCFLRAAQMYAEFENYEDAFKNYETSYRLLEKIKKTREAENAISWMILTQLALARIDNATSIARGKTLNDKDISGIANALVKLVSGYSVKIPRKKGQEGQKTIKVAIQNARTYAALKARLNTKVDDTVVGKNIDVLIHFQTKKLVTVTSLNLHVTNHAKQISEITPNPPFQVKGGKKVRITLALTLAGELTVGPLSFDFESDGYQFNKTAKPIKVRVRPAKGHVTLEFEQHKVYLKDDHAFAEGEVSITNTSQGLVEKIDVELHPPSKIILVGTTPKKTINMLSPGRSVNFPVILKSKRRKQQRIEIRYQVDQSPRKSEKISLDFEIEEKPEPEEEDTDWLKDLETS